MTKFILMISVERRVQCTVISPVITSECNYCLCHVRVRINTNVLLPAPAAPAISDDQHDISDDGEKAVIERAKMVDTSLYEVLGSGL